MSRLISLKEASLISGYHQDYLSFLIRNNKLDGERIGRVWSVREDEIKQFIDGKKAATDLVGGNSQNNKNFLINKKTVTWALAIFSVILFFSYVVIAKENNLKENITIPKKTAFSELQVNTVYSENAKEVYSFVSNTNH